MGFLTRDDLRNQLKRREIAPVYLLFGPESYLRDLASRTISDLVLKDAALRDFNETEFSLNSPDSLVEVLAAANQLPMMGDRRVVRVTDVRVSATGGRDTLKEEHEGVLSAYLANPSPTTVLLFIADDFDKRRRMAKLLGEHSVAVEFKHLEDEEAVQWAKGRLKDGGFEYDDRAPRLLVDLVGDDLRRLANEIDKVTTAALPQKLVTDELVERLVGNSRELSNFELADHLINRNRAKALKVLGKILDDGAEPLMILGLVANNFRRLLLAKSMMEQGADRSEVAKVLKLPYRKQEDFLSAARRADMSGISRTMKRIAETDLAIKTSRGGGGPAGSRRQIEMLVCEIVG
jgi:DNA polymerase-3 subunit delta